PRSRFVGYLDDSERYRHRAADRDIRIAVDIARLWLGTLDDSVMGHMAPVRSAGILDAKRSGLCQRYTDRRAGDPVRCRRIAPTRYQRCRPDGWSRYAARLEL